MSIKVLVIDHIPLMRLGLRQLLERDGRATIVTEASNARDGYLALDACAPDVAIVDERLSGEDGVAATEELLRRARGLRVLMLIGAARPHTVVDAIQAGARGVALKHQSGDELLEAIVSVAHGTTYLAPEISVVDVEVELERRRLGGSSLSRLSPRQRGIFALLVRGFDNAQIARELFISVKTVETHRAQVFSRLGVHSLAELVRYAATRSLLQPDA